MSSSTGPLGRRNILRRTGFAALAIFGTGTLAACTSAVGEQQAAAGDDAKPVRIGERSQHREQPFTRHHQPIAPRYTCKIFLTPERVKGPPPCPFP